MFCDSHTATEVGILNELSAKIPLVGGRDYCDVPLKNSRERKKLKKALDSVEGETISI